jgi:hypothetical protein
LAGSSREGDDEALLTEVEAARLLCLSPRTLQAARIQGTGPRYVKIGRNVRYRWRDLRQFIQEREVRSTSETPPCDRTGK